MDNQARTTVELLDAITAAEIAYQEALAETIRLLRHRDDLIRAATAVRPRIRRTAIATAANISEPMLYKITSREDAPAT